MSRLSRKNREDILLVNKCGITDLFDNHFKTAWRISDLEYNHICEFASDDELEMLIREDLTISEAKHALEIVDKYIIEYYETLNENSK